MSLNIWMIIGLSIFLLFTIVMAFMGAKQVKSIKDFSISGGMGPIMLGLAFAASYFSAGAYTGFTGYVYSFGYSALWLIVSIVGGSTLGFIVLAKGVRLGTGDLKVNTIPDWLATVYKSDVLRVIISLVVFFQIFFVAGQLTAGAQLLSTMIEGLDYKTWLLIIAIIVAFYSALGGMYSDVYTSVGQMSLMLIASIIIFVGGLSLFDGGFTEVTARLAEIDANLITPTNPSSPHFGSALTIFGIIFVETVYCAQPATMGKIMALKNPKDMRKMILVWMVASAVCMSALFGGAFIRAAGVEVSRADQSLFILCKTYFHPIASVIVSVGILAAMMSTVSSLVVVISSCVANDIFAKTLVQRNIIKMDKEKVDKVSLTIARIFPFIITGVSVLLVIEPPPFISDMIWVGNSAIGSATLPLMIYALFLPKRKNTKAAITASLSGFLCFILIYMVFHLEKSVMAAGAWSILFSLIVMTVMCFATPKKAQ